MRIGRYEVEGSVGRGAMGTVVRARGPSGELVAIKVLNRRDPEAVARFARERRLLETLGETEGFVPLLDAGTSEHGPFVVMPFVEGGTLAERLARGPLGFEETRRLGIELARALGLAHERGIVHRDMKPANVLLAPSGRPLVADLGLAKHFEPDASGSSTALTRTGAFHGTLGYTAPEQVSGARDVRPQADVFSVGAILYECLAGHPPFPGDSAIEIATRLESGAFVPLRAERPGVPTPLAATIERCLARDPARRFQDGAALARALEAPEGASRGRGPVVVALLLVAAVAVALLALRATQRPLRPPETEASAETVAALVSEARMLVGRGEHERAIQVLGRAVSLAPRRLEARLDRVRALERLERHAEALAEATKAIETDPGAAIAWAERVHPRCQEIAGATSSVPALKADAERDVARAFALDPGSIAACEARLDLDIVTRNVGAIEKDMAETLALDPRNPRALLVRATVTMHEDPDSALRDATLALEADPLLATAFSTRSQLELARHEVEKAILDGQRATILRPRSAVMWLTLGKALRAEQRNEEALDALDRAVALEPTWAEAGAERIDLLLAMGRDAQAASDLEAVMRKLPESADLLSLHATILHKLGRTADAIRDLDRALEIDPRHVTSYGRRGLFKESIGQRASGIADCTHALAIDPKNQMTLFARGMMLLRQGDAKAAAADLRKCAAVAPKTQLAAAAAQQLAQLEKDGR